MLYGYGLASLLTLGLAVYCALNVITTPESAVRNLPKLLWLALVVLFPVVGGIAWLVAGRPERAASRPYQGSHGGNPGVPAEYDRPGRATASSPEDDAAFLQQLRERAQAQRAAADEQRRQALEDEERRRAAERAARRHRLDDSPA